MSITVPLYGFGGGGGAALNFKVVGGLELPINPKENTIWVKTDVDITGWVFSATEPDIEDDGKDGSVWFKTGTTSPVEFNALRKNGVKVYPLSVKQHVGNAWVNKIAQSYQNNRWNEWIPEFFYKDGVEDDQYPINIETIGNASFEKTESAITLTSSSSTAQTRICAYISNFDLSIIKYIKVRINVEVVNGLNIELAIRKNSISDVTVEKTAGKGTGTQVLDLDVSAYSGAYYITLSAGNDGANARYAKFSILEWWVEMDENNVAISDLEAAYQEGVNAAYDQ